MSNVWIAISPSLRMTRILAMAGASETILKAHLSPDPSHPRALPTLLEAIALWQGTKVRAALVAENTEGASDSSLFREAFHDFGDLHYTLDWIPARAVRRDIAGVGDFSDLRKLLVSKVAR